MTIIHTALTRAAPRRVEIEEEVFVRIEKRVRSFRRGDRVGRGMGEPRALGSETSLKSTGEVG